MNKKEKGKIIHGEVKHLSKKYRIPLVVGFCLGVEERNYSSLKKREKLNYKEKLALSRANFEKRRKLLMKIYPFMKDRLSRVEQRLIDRLAEYTIKNK